MPQEYVQLVNDNNEPLGEALKSEVHTDKTPLHRAFSIFVFNSKGDLLLQQRAGSKKTWPLIWSNSCCGHPAPGEETKDAALRRLKEELGLELKEIDNMLPSFRYRAELNGIVENEICPVFIAFSDQDPKANPEEVESIKWIPWQTFVQQAESGQSDYSPWSILEAKELAASQTFRQILKQQTNGKA